MHVPPPLHAGVNAENEMVVGPVSAVVAESDQYTWKGYRFKLCVRNARISVGGPVVDNGRVTVIVRLAAAAEPAPQRVRRHRPVDRRAALVEDREALVDDLHVMARTYGTVRVGWRRVDAERAGRPSEALADAL